MGAPAFRLLSKGVVVVRLKRRITSAIGAFGLVLVGFCSIASPAQAAASPDTWYVGCNAENTALLLFSSNLTRTGNTGSMTAAPGDSVSILDFTGSPNIGCTGAPVPGYGIDVQVGGSWVATNTHMYSVTFVSGDSSISVRANGGTPANTFTVMVSRTRGGGGGGGGSSSAPAAPADVMQQVGVPADGKCSSIVDATLNWAGVSSGGWGTSWAQWMNGGKGGAVCNRALIYSLGLSKWVVNA